MTSTSAQINIGVTNFAALFLDRVQATPDKEAFRYLDQREWVSVTQRDAAIRVESLAAGLLALGIEPGTAGRYRIPHQVWMDLGRPRDYVRRRSHHDRLKCLGPRFGLANVPVRRALLSFRRPAIDSRCGVKACSVAARECRNQDR